MPACYSAGMTIFEKFAAFAAGLRRIISPRHRFTLSYVLAPERV